MAIRNSRTVREASAAASDGSTYYGATTGRETDTGASHDIRNGLRWLLGGVFAFFLGVVLGEVWPESGAGPRSAGPRTAAHASVASGMPSSLPTEMVEVGTHRLSVPTRLLSGGEVSAARRSRGGFVTHLAWADPENPVSDSSRRCIEARPRCRESLTMVVTSSRLSAEQQWSSALRGLAQVGGGDAYGVRFFTAPPGQDGRGQGVSLEFGERSASGRTVYGRCPRSRRDLPQAGAVPAAAGGGGSPGVTALARQTATIDPAANCTLTFDVRPGLSVTLLVRGEKLAEWRRAQVAAANLVEGFMAAAVASRA